MNTAIFVLRALQVGLRLTDLELLEVGDVMDIIIEQNNDACEYEKKATQADFERF